MAVRSDRLGSLGIALAVVFCTAITFEASRASSQYAEIAAARRAMVDHIRMIGGPGSLYGLPGVNEAVLAAMGDTPRHEFVPEAVRPYAYEDTPLPIGYEQTISQPYIVGLMTDLLRTEPHHVVLEIGTGSGYQAAVLSRLVKTVFTIEIVSELARRAQADLARTGHGNVRVRDGDGYFGWPEEAPFDGIMVTAGAPEPPAALIDQLKTGARMVIPVDHAEGQMLIVLVKRLDGGVDRENVLPVRFVPLTGKGGRN